MAREPLGARGASARNGLRRRGRGTAVKIVVTGPFAAGKTTLIRTISEITVLSTERAVSDAAREGKTQTTVAMDFGRITIDSDLVLYLFGTPGQERFDFMWEILGDGMLGYILLLDGTQADPATAAAGILAAFRRMARVPFVVAVNRGRLGDEAADAALRTALELEPEVPLLSCDASDRESVKSVLLALLTTVLSSLTPVAAGT